MNKPNHCWRCEAACTQPCSRCRVAFYCSEECQTQDKWRHKPDCDAAALPLQCTGCKIEQRGLLACTNCLKAVYCSKKCQSNDWKRHKALCEQTVERTLALVKKIQENLKMKENFSAGLFVTYYWGNSPAVDLLNLSMNEGEEYPNPLALLLCGVGDPRNVLLTIVSMPDVYTKQVSFVLNDICPCTLARTILLLYMLYKGGDKITYTVIRIWYSVCITEEDFNLLTSALQDLATTAELNSLTNGIMELSVKQLKELKSVWTTWLFLSQREEPWVSNERKRVYSTDPDVDIGLSRYVGTIPKLHRSSVKRFLDTGIFHSTANPKHLTRQNATLTGRAFRPLTASAEFHYSMTSDLLPFVGWDYKTIKEVCYADSLPEMYTIYLSQILQKSVEKMGDGRVKFHFILCAALDIEPYLPAVITYDRIATSNLWDYHPLPVLLTHFKKFLNTTNPHAAVLTETMNMPIVMPEIVEQVPNSYGIDLPYEMAIEDTQDPELVFSSGISTVVEYLNLTDEFVQFLRASLLVSSTNDDVATFNSRKRIPSVKSLVRSMGLFLRDFTRNENTVFPFKWAINCRRVNMMRGYIRTLEWKLTPGVKVEVAVD